MRRQYAHFQMSTFKKRQAGKPDLQNAVGGRIVGLVTRPPAECRLSVCRLLALSAKAGSSCRALPFTTRLASPPRRATALWRGIHALHGSWWCCRKPVTPFSAICSVCGPCGTGRNASPRIVVRDSRPTTRNARLPRASWMLSHPIGSQPIWWQWQESNLQPQVCSLML